jgi:solute carrier family 8 (sodium/calcium exchanger)
MPRQVTDEKGQSSQVEVLFWNATVANLTLMALGSSAPEILLAIIETLMTLASDEPPGELGPATIVGSAAFNLLGITAVCMLAVPDGAFLPPPHL